MPTVKVNDIELYYEILGEGSPVVAIRGWGSSSQNWSPVLVEKLSRQFKLIIFDNRGTGRTSKPDSKYSIEMMADDTAGLLDKLNVPKAHIIGFSMGGMIAQKFGVKYPDKTVSLVLACTRPDSYVAPTSESARRVMEYMISKPEDMPDGDLQKQVIQLYSTPEYIEKHGEVMLDTALNSKLIPTPGYARRRQMEASMEFSSLDELSLIESPTLVIHGEKDAWIPVENGRIIAERVPGSKLVLFDRSGHAFIEQRVEMIETILEFLSSIEEKRIKSSIF